MDRFTGSLFIGFSVRLARPDPAHSLTACVLSLPIERSTESGAESEFDLGTRAAPTVGRQARSLTNAGTLIQNSDCGVWQIR
jgi:hypothetical protein